MHPRVLLIEDEPQIADFIVRGLQEEGFRVHHCADGNTGWGALQVGGWDTVLLDWWLPGQDGLSIVQRLRAGGDHVPVLFLTARDAVADRVNGLDGGADDYLCKPFAFEELVARVRAMTRRKLTAAGTLLRYENISVDLTNHRVERAGKLLELTTKEQALLTFFLRHPERVLSRAQIYQQVWDELYDGLSNTLEVHINQLRRKLGSNEPRLIHTVRNRGYVLSALDYHDASELE